MSLDIDFPADAQILIEASAGTGKTFALAGLFMQAVIVHRLRVADILAVTYTEAATQELRRRIRQRLSLAVQMTTHTAVSADTADAAASTHEAGTAATTQAVAGAITAEQIARASASGEAHGDLHMRLQQALRDIDMASIHSIHGFCRRVLDDFALEAGQPLLPAEIQAQDREHREALAVELWRALAQDEEGADFLQRRFGTLSRLAQGLRDLLASEPLLPTVPQQTPPDPRPAMRDAFDGLKQAFAGHCVEARAVVEAAISEGVLKANEYKAEHVDAVWSALGDVCQRDHHDAPPHPKLHKYQSRVLQAGTKKDFQHRIPVSPLFAAIEHWLDVCGPLDAWRDACDLGRLHALRALAQQRDAARKQAANVRGYDDLIGDLHAALADPGRAEALAAAVRARYRRVLIDEFQDTDARQWAIFRRLFSGSGMALVGDPKQAIYRFRGGDVQTYLAAADAATSHERLLHNFRSRPCLLVAVNALFQHGGADAFGQSGIAFAPARPSGHCDDEAYRSGAEVAPAMEFHLLAPPAEKNWNKQPSVKRAASACAGRIATLLHPDSPHRLRERDEPGHRPLKASDCVVLVREHEEARAVREALARHGISAVSAGRKSLYATAEATEILALLLAAATPADGGRLRAVLAMPLLGQDAQAIAQLEDSDALHGCQRDLEHWQQLWQRHGPQAMLTEVIARNAARLLALPDGERALTNLLHLAERLQEQAPRALGLPAQVAWLQARIGQADDADETQQLRLESDAGRVQIMTLHASKGLEFPLVFLPFCGIGRGGGHKSDFVMYQHGDTRVRQWNSSVVGVDTPSWDEAKENARREECDEDMRLLYVGLTRARHALWIACGRLSCSENAALCRLLGGHAPTSELLQTSGAVLTTDDATDDLQRLRAPLQVPAVDTGGVPDPRSAQRLLSRDWWVHSFSQWQRGHALQADAQARRADEAPAADEMVAGDAGDSGRGPSDRRFSGVHFGNALHAALERIEFARWRDAGDSMIPDGQRPLLEAALLSHGYAQADVEAGVQALAPLINATLAAQLPEGTRLLDIATSERRAEMEFHFVLAPSRVDDTLRLLQRFGVGADRRSLGSRDRLEGLLTGKIDLVYRHAGRWYLADYKSNWLDDGYGAEALQAAMRNAGYDLQALVYTLAVHRWLRFRLGDGYDYTREFGGVRYLFCRGLAEGGGIHVDTPAPEFVHALDALWSGDRP